MSFIDPAAFDEQYLAELEELAGLVPVETDDDESAYGQGTDTP